MLRTSNRQFLTGRLIDASLSRHRKLRSVEPNKSEIATDTSHSVGTRTRVYQTAENGTLFKYRYGKRRLPTEWVFCFFISLVGARARPSRSSLAKHLEMKISKLVEISTSNITGLSLSFERWLPCSDGMNESSMSWVSDATVSRTLGVATHQDRRINLL
jgi:hypothetical protein